MDTSRATYFTVSCTVLFLLFTVQGALSKKYHEPVNLFTNKNEPGADVGAGTGAAEDDSGRIVGGVLTTIEKHPHQVSLRYRGQHACGASIISENWIVTAAHCASISDDPGIFSILAGSSVLKGGEDEGEVVKVKRIIVHERYDDEYADYDIAVMKLAKRLVWSDRVRPIALPSRYDSLRSGSKATVSGWGHTEVGGRTSNQLREVTVPIVSNSECNRIYRRRRISPRMLCAGYIHEGGKDACQGDSGGPLVSEGNLIGIVSWGFGCADIYPGVYTRVTVFRSWISENTGI